jgi:hypothetical protein
MNENELSDRMNEIIGIAQALLAESTGLRQQVETLQITVNKLESRLIYREKVLVGWKEISQHIGLSVSQALRLVDEAFDPLPVVREGHQVIASAHALDAWKMRRRAGYRKVLRVSVQESGETPS